MEKLSSMKCSKGKSIVKIANCITLVNGSESDGIVPMKRLINVEG